MYHCATGLEFNHLILISDRRGYPSRWPGAISWKSLLEPLSLPLGDRQLLLGEVVGKQSLGLRLNWKSISQMTVLRMVEKNVYYVLETDGSNKENRKLVPSLSAIQQG